MSYQDQQQAAPAIDVVAERPRTPVGVHVLCGWPLLLVLIGGAIGGGLGGAAYAINLSVYKSQLPMPAKVILNVVIGLSAIGLWVAIVTAIQLGRQ